MNKRIFTAHLLAIFILHVSAQAPEPAFQPTDMQFAAIKTYNFVMSFTGVQADGYLILKSSNPILTLPSDGVTYEKGQGLPDSKVMYVGPNTVHNVRGEVWENTRYYFKVFAYNGSGSAINYLQTNPLYDSISTPASSPNGYYDDVSPNSWTFVGDLSYLIRNHTVVAYSAYRNNIVPDFFQRDTINGQSVINCEYSNTTTLYTPPFDFVAQQYNREHALPRSWMPTGGSTSNADGADYYNLLLTRDIPNNTRSNHPLGIVLNVTQTFGESKFGLNSNGQQVFEPRDDRKGDAARAMFYQMVCYNGNNGTWGFDFMPTFAPNQDQSILKFWHQQDPPDKFERTKNEYIASLQNNRNPFIDFPDWVNCINFDSLVKTSLCGAISSISDAGQSNTFRVFPNPVSTQLTIEMLAANSLTARATIFDVVGNEVMHIELITETTGVDVSHLVSGMYLLQMSVDGVNSYRRFMVQN